VESNCVYTFFQTTHSFVDKYNNNNNNSNNNIKTKNLKERDHWGDPDVDGRIILRWIFRKWEGVVGTGGIWLRIGTSSGQL
jgi:hypothetical protein